MRRRLLVTIGASVLIFSGLVGLLQGRSDNPAIRGQADAVVAFSRATHAVVAYAGYWDSLALSWASYEAVPVYPLAPCPVGFCPFHFNKISSWYAPRRGVRSVLILDPARDNINGISVPAANLGPPIASETVDGLQLFAYSYDIAARFGTSHGD